MASNMLNYEDEYKNFRWNIPDDFNFGFDVIDKWAEKNDKLALLSISGGGESAQKHTFRELSLLSNRFANVLVRHGVKKGDRIIVMIPQIPEWYVVVLGCIKLGAVFIPTPSLSTAKDLEYRFKQSGAVAVAAHSTFAARFDEIRERCPSLKKLIIVDCPRENWLSYQDEMSSASPEFKPRARTKSSDPMLILFTSGTTGFQKMVLHHQSYALAHELTARYFHDSKPDDIHWTIADPGWAKAAYGKLFGQWDIGAAVVQHDNKGRFHPEITLKILQNYGITSFCAPPTAYRMLVQQDLSKFRFPELRHCTSAGEPLSAETIKMWKEATGLFIHDAYGQSETIAVISNYPCMPIKPGSMGKPMPGYQIAIIDKDGHELPAGVRGQIAIKVKPQYPPGLFASYWHDPEAMKECFRGDWYYTGDIAYKDEDGYYWFVGRADDLIKSSGYRIGPFEVESALQEHPAVAESAAIGVPDPVRGEIVKAFVVLKAGYTGSNGLARELQETVKRITAPYKYPRKIEFVASLPKNENGKILRVKLREQEAQKAAALYKAAGNGEIFI